MSDLMSLNEASDVFGITTQTIRRWAEQGRIEFVKPDRVHVFVRKDEMIREVPHVGRLLVRLQAYDEALTSYEEIVDGSDVH